MERLMLDELGREMPDGTPMEVPFHLRGQESIDQRVARLVAQSLSRAAQETGMETEEEANDFDIPDDDPTGGLTSHELLGDDELANALRDLEAEAARRGITRPSGVDGGSGRSGAADQSGGVGPGSGGPGASAPANVAQPGRGSSPDSGGSSGAARGGAAGS